MDPQSFDVPPLAAGLLACPNCQSRDLERLVIPEAVVIAHKPRICKDCQFEWTPRPSVPVLVLCGISGIVFVLASATSVIWLPKLVYSWLTSGVLMGAFHVLYVLGVAACSYVAFRYGMGLLEYVRHVRRLFRQFHGK